MGLTLLPRGRHIPVAMNYLGVLLAVLAAILLSWFALEFADWNKHQACATSGGRNCGAPRAYFSH